MGSAARQRWHRHLPPVLHRPRIRGRRDRHRDQEYRHQRSRRGQHAHHRRAGRAVHWDRPGQPRGARHRRKRYHAPEHHPRRRPRILRGIPVHLDLVLGRIPGHPRPPLHHRQRVLEVPPQTAPFLEPSRGVGLRSTSTSGARSGSSESSAAHTTAPAGTGTA